MTLPQVTLPLLSLFVLLELPPAGRALAALALLVPAFFSSRWAIDMEPALRQYFAVDSFSPGIDTVNCRAETGARLFEEPVPTYAPEREWYTWSGCRPLFAPGNERGTGTLVDVAGPIAQEAALAALADNFVSAGAELHAACPASGSADRVCQRISDSAHCRASGSWRVCAVSAGERSALLAR